MSDGATNDIKKRFHRRAAGGCTVWNVDAAVVSLTLHDGPVGYTPPVGHSYAPS